MEIELLDKNFATVNDGENGEKAVYTIPHEKFGLYGVYFAEDEKRFRRLPSEVADNISYNLSVLSTNTAGGRLRFSTNSNTIGLEVTYPSLAHMTHMPYTGCNGFSLLEEKGKKFNFVTVFRPAFGEETGFKQVIKVEGGKMKDYILFFPLYNSINSVKIILDVDATVTSGRKYRDVKPILYYGSSITQGACASRADGAYQALISKWNNIDFINLGFSGGCKAEDIMIEHLLTYDPSIFVLDYDHNAPTPQYLRETHYSLYKRYRQAHPNTPILFVSRPDYERRKDNPEKLSIIIESFNKAKAEGDNNVYFLSGKNLFGENDRENCTVDGCHPTDLGFYSMYVRLADEIKSIIDSGKLKV